MHIFGRDLPFLETRYLGVRLWSRIDEKRCGPPQHDHILVYVKGCWVRYYFDGGAPWSALPYYMAPVPGGARRSHRPLASPSDRLPWWQHQSLPPSCKELPAHPNPAMKPARPNSCGRKSFPGVQIRRPGVGISGRTVFRRQRHELWLQHPFEPSGALFPCWWTTIRRRSS